MEAIRLSKEYDDQLLNLSLDTIKKNKQALVFCNTKRGAESQAERIAKKTKLHIDKLNYFEELAEKILKAVSSPTKQCKRLAFCVKKGVAFHHAGLNRKQRELIEDNFRNNKIFIICSTPTLCLSGDTNIWHGVLETKISDFKINKSVYALKNNDLCGIKPQKVNLVSNFDNLIKFESVSGRSIKVTPNHKMLVKRNNKRLLLKAKDVLKTDKIATIGKLTYHKTIKLNISDFVRDNVLPKNTLLTPDFAYFIGLLLGDGYSGAEINNSIIKYKGSPCIVGIDKEVFSFVKTICEQLNLSYRVNKNQGGTPQLILGKNKWFREFLVRSGVDLRDKKHISNKFMQTSLVMIASLLRGLFDTDGYVETSGAVGFSNTSKLLVYQIQKLLLRFGIVSSIRRRKEGSMKIRNKEYVTMPHYELTIKHKLSLFKYYEQINFFINRKKESLQIIIDKLNNNINNSCCKKCDYKIYSNLFSGRSKFQKLWGSQKEKVISLLNKRDLTSRQLVSLLGFEPKKNSSRLNHHYELINKVRIKNDWLWSLNDIGKWIYKNNLNNFFSLDNCPLCNSKLEKTLNSGWRSNDFEGDIYWDIIRKISTVNSESKVYDLVLPSKPVNDHLFVANGFIVHNSAGLDLPAFRAIIKDTKRFSAGKGWGMVNIPVLEYHQMAGRAGRPGKEDFGEAILIANNEQEAEDLETFYIKGVPEDIYSKLAVEPVLRTYLLSLISTGFIKDYDTMFDFFDNTFYAAQYGDLSKLHDILNKMLSLLEEWEFIIIKGRKIIKEDSLFKSADKIIEPIKNNGESFRATPLGTRVAQLYIDPYTAAFLIKYLKKATSKKHSLNDFALLHLLSSTIELRPLLKPKQSDYEIIDEKLIEEEGSLLVPEPNSFSYDYEEFLAAIKTAMFFEDWIDETPEDQLFERYNVRPGEIQAKKERANWLIYSCEELCKVLAFQTFLTPLAKMKIRLEYGVKEDLLNLLRFKNIGKVRARVLYKNSIKSVGDVKNADFSTLIKLIGPKTAANLKEQVGEKVDPEKIKVKPNKRKGQKSLEDYG